MNWNYIRSSAERELAVRTRSVQHSPSPRESEKRWMLEGCKLSESCSHDVKFARKFMMANFTAEDWIQDLLLIICT